MNGIAFAASLVLFVGGIALFAYAFETPGFETAMFVAGIAAIVAAIAIPFHVLKRTES
jgi:cytochrome b subunit of formate dehydrogenase